MLRNLLDMWRQARPEARLGLVTGAVLIVALVGYFAWTVLRPDYQTLFANLDPQDAAAMTAELDKLKVPYRVDHDGATILVDKAQVHALRLKLLGKAGTLKSGVGFEIFNNTDYGMTEFAQKINYQRALQGELTRTIQALDEVKAARVHLVLPESGLFRKTGQKPKAAITLTLKDGRSLAPEQVLGIQRLVAASVPDIEPSGVTITDQRGVTLTRAGGDGEDGLAGRLGSKAEVEAYLTRKLVALFDRAFGPGRVIVSVDATLNHDQIKVTREDVLPLATRGGEAVGAVVRSRTTTVNGDGTGSVVPATTASAASGSTNDRAGSGSTTSEIEYQSGRRVEQVVSSPGGIKRLSVAVVLPNVSDRARLDEVRQLVATTVGINPTRGDEIAITSLDLSALPAKPVTGIAKPEEVAVAGADAETAAVAPGAGRSGPVGFAGLRDWGLPAVVIALALLVLGVVVTGRGRRERVEPRARPREEVLQNVERWLRQDPLTGEGRKA